jgi:hypothetical protein
VVSVTEAVQAAKEQQAVADLKKKFAEAKPTTEMLQHISATHPFQSSVTITLLDGTVYKTPSLDFMFTDGLSIVHDQHRIYIPKTSIKSILIHNPGE